MSAPLAACHLPVGVDTARLKVCKLVAPHWSVGRVMAISAGTSKISTGTPNISAGTSKISTGTPKDEHGYKKELPAVGTGDVYSACRVHAEPACIS